MSENNWRSFPITPAQERTIMLIERNTFWRFRPVWRTRGTAADFIDKHIEESKERAAKLREQREEADRAYFIDAMYDEYDVM
jgi:hypothetical protein